MTTNTHDERTAQDHVELEPQAQPSESEPIRTTIKKGKHLEPGIFDVGRYRCWMMGNGTKG